jgi:hypothetical protein
VVVPIQLIQRHFGLSHQSVSRLIKSLTEAVINRVKSLTEAVNCVEFNSINQPVSHRINPPPQPMNKYTPN